MIPTGCTSSWSSRSRKARLKSDGKPAKATLGPSPGVTVAGGGGRSRSGMNVKISCAQRSRPILSRYADVVAMSAGHRATRRSGHLADPTGRGDRAHQPLADECLENGRDVAAVAPARHRPGAFLEFVEAGRGGGGGHDL